MSAAVDHVTADLRAYEDAVDANERLREAAECEVARDRELLTDDLEEAEIRDLMHGLMAARGKLVTDQVARALETERVFDLLRERAVEKHMEGNA